MLYSCTHMATVGVKGLKTFSAITSKSVMGNCKLFQNGYIHKLSVVLFAKLHTKASKLARTITTTETKKST